MLQTDDFRFCNSLITDHQLMSFLFMINRTASVIAVSDGQLWAMDRTSFKRIVVQSAYRKRKTFDSFLQNVPMLSSLDSYERLNVADALVSKVFNSGQCIVKEGDPGDGMYFIEEGEVKVTIRKSGKETEIKRLTRGMYFGEMALVENKPRTASVYAVGPDKVRVAFLERDSFERLLGPCIDLMKREMGSYEYSS